MVRSVIQGGRGWGGQSYANSAIIPACHLEVFYTFQIRLECARSAPFSMSECLRLTSEFPAGSQDSSFFFFGVFESRQKQRGGGVLKSGLIVLFESLAPSQKREAGEQKLSRDSRQMCRLHSGIPPWRSGEF